MTTTPESKRHRHGDVREDGKVFLYYRKRQKNPEYWVSPERFAMTKLNAKLSTQALRERRLEETPKKMRKTRWKPSRTRLRRKVIQKTFDRPICPYNTEPAMTDTSHLTVIPNYSKYAMAPNGDVYRIDPATRGRTAGERHRVTPVIHPKGHQWYVQITDDEGNRRRVGVKKLMFALFGQSETIA